MKLLNRREFFKYFTFANIFFLFSSILFFVFKFISFPTSGKNFIVKIEKSKLKNSINEFPESKIAVIYNDNKLYVLSTVCTHLGCTVKWDNLLNIFQCPCHQSAFDINGKVIRFPAKKNLKTLKFMEKDKVIIVWLKNS